MARPKLTDPVAVEEAISQARQWAQEHKVAMTVERLAVALGVAREPVIRYASGEPNGGDCDEEGRENTHTICGMISRAYDEIAASQAEYGMTNDFHMVQFLLKNNHKYRDRIEAELTGALPVVIKGEDQLPD